MRMYLLKCPECGAELEVEPERVSCFCSYCGSKVYLDDNTKRVEITKNIKYHKTYTNEAKIKDIESRERMFDKQFAAEIESEKRKRRAGFRTFLIVAICVVLFFAGSDYYFGTIKNESDAQEIELQRVVDEIMQDIEEGDYSSARIKAESLYYTADWSDEIEEKWDATRETLIEQIDEAEKIAQRAEKEASGGDWWNPFD